MTLRNLRLAGFALLATTALGGAASATQIEITVTNNAPTGGLFLTPLLSVFHDGNFDTFDLGAAASAGVEALAEDGNFNIEKDRAEGLGYATSVHTGPAGFGSTAPQPPLLDAGESTSIIVDLDPNSDQYYTFLSMVLPSNDNFIGNANPFAYRLFDDAGNFTGIGDIEVLGNEVWDAGTEENNLLGAPFSAIGGTGPATDTIGGVVALADLSFINGAGTPVGPITSLPGANGLLATISFEQVAPVPLPAALPMLLGGLGIMGLTGLRRRKQS